jgi:hypothetical protein
MKRGKGICLLQHLLMEGCLLRYKVSCLLMGMILWNGNEFGGCLLRLQGVEA